MPRTPSEPRTHGGRRINAGRKPGIRLRCGECQRALTAREWRGHFTACPARFNPPEHADVPTVPIP
jgi:uncharacterized CHY-type Zn-finger protein